MPIREAEFLYREEMTEIPVNIAILGAWNPFIFTPEWVKKHLATSKESEVTMAISVGSNLPPKLTVEGVNIYPSSNVVILDFEGSGTCALCFKMVEVASKLISLLGHTPLTAVGMNFRYFLDASKSNKITELFSFEDSSKIDSNKYLLKSSEIRRTYSFKDVQLNLGIFTNSEKICVEFNFHLDSSDGAKITEFLTQSKAKDFLESSESFLSNVYDLEVKCFDEQE